MISVDGFAILAHRGSAGFSAPDDEGVLPPALLEVEDEGGAGLLDIFADLF